MGIMLSALAIVIIAAICIFGGPTTFAVVMAFLAVIMGGLTAGIIGALVLTNFYKANFDKAFTRSVIAGASMATVIGALCTLLTCALTGGFAVIVPVLWSVSLKLAVCEFAAAAATMVIWGVTVMVHRKKSHR